MISLFISFLYVLITFQFLLTQAVPMIDIRNNCPFTVWAAAVPGGGQRLDYGGIWRLQPVDKVELRIWGRTNCNFDTSGRGQCQTGDCKGLLQCQDFGTPPFTLTEYNLNQSNNLDFLDISLVTGFNVPMEISPTISTSYNCSVRISCTANIIGQCPDELRIPGGCNNPCTVFKTCGPTNYSSFFKDRCPNAYSYPQDDSTSIFSCPTGTNYRVVFCP